MNITAVNKPHMKRQEPLGDLRRLIAKPYLGEHE
jgi:hypothetical protein